MVANEAPSSDIDPFDETFLADPWPYHERLREAGPVVFLEKYGIWSMARHSEVSSSLQDWETFCSGAGAGMTNFRLEKSWRRPSIILEADPPLHTRTHKVLLRILAPSALRDLKVTFEREAALLVDELVSRGRFDGAEDLGKAFPLRVFPDAVGVREEGRENLLTIGNMSFNAFGPRNERYETALAASEIVLAAIMEMCERDALASDGFGPELYKAADAGEITPDEASLLIRTLLSAGLDTTINSLTAALLCLAQNPAAFEMLRDDPTLVRTVFDEAIRLESPVQTFFRTTTRAVTVSGVSIPDNSKVLLFLASANRDPRKWENADSYDIKRRTGGHVGFGSGIHRCVGELLARLEGEAVLSALARRVRSIRLDGTPRLRFNNTIRGYESLPLVVQA